MNRRVFLGVGAAAVLRADVLPSHRVSLGVIGVGWMGFTTMKIFMGDPRVHIAGICDIDADHLKEASAAAPDAPTFHEFEELLARHPKLRLQVMHAGYPMIDNMLTLLQANSHVYVDVAGLIWSYPIKEVNHYIQRIVEAGFEDRVMFGTDQLIWPKLMAYSISVIQNAEYLTPEQKRDILYNNAARFLRLDPAAAK